MGGELRLSGLSRQIAGSPSVKTFVPIISICLAGLLSGCATQPQRTAGSTIDPKYGVSASPRVVADGEPVPKGGGAAMVGKPYTIAGQTYYPSERAYSAVGLASWYGSAFHGRRTANGEVFDRMSISAAHPTLPLPSYARVTNLRNHHSMIVRVNDRGPYHAGRVMDVSEQVADALGFRGVGTAKVRVDFVSKASLAGSDDRKLLATLRTDGSAASVGRDGAVYVAGSEDAPVVPVRVVSASLASAAVSSVTDAEDEGDAAMPSPRKIVSAPLPPARPFDLGTIPGAAAPIAATRATGSRADARTLQAMMRSDDLPTPRARR